MSDVPYAFSVEDMRQIGREAARQNISRFPFFWPLKSADQIKMVRGLIVQICDEACREMISFEEDYVAAFREGFFGAINEKISESEKALGIAPGGSPF